MGTSFWIRRFVLVALTLFIIIGGVQYLKGHSAGYSIGQGILWALVSATIFTVSRFYQSRRGQHCALCNDIPDQSGRPPAQ